MKIILAVLVLIIAIIAAPMLMSPSPDRQTGQAVQGLPWQVEALPDGNSKAFGLTIGASTLADVRSRFGSDVVTAIVAAPGETGDIEAYFQDVTLGAVTGKLVATADIPAKTVEEMRQRATRSEYMESNTKKYTLAPDDLLAADAAPIKALTFIPAINLDEQIVLQRFGKPAERIHGAEHIEHFLYPERGLDVILDSDGKEVLQYVPPRQFAQLRAPLIAKR